MYRAPTALRQTFGRRSSRSIAPAVGSRFLSRKDAAGSERFRRAGRERICEEAFADAVPAILACRWFRSRRGECPNRSAAGPWARASCCPSGIQPLAAPATNPMEAIRFQIAPSNSGTKAVREGLPAQFHRMRRCASRALSHQQARRSQFADFSRGPPDSIRAKDTPLFRPLLTVWESSPR